MSCLSWLAILASVTFIGTVRCAIYEGTSKEEPFTVKDTDDVMTINRDATEKLSDESIKELLDSTDGFLAGEDTPVWIAHRSSLDKPVNYTKLEKGIVKKAIDYWKSNEFKGITRARRNVDENLNIVEKFRYSTLENLPTLTTDIDDESVVKNVVEITMNRLITSDPEILYPSVMIMMDYAIDWPADKINQQNLIMERILYSLAFWNGVDLQLRHIKNPKVRLRISGIIIARNKEATPYVHENEGWLGLSVEQAFLPMLRYWRNVTAVNPDFPKRSYDIVATMTDSTPASGFFRTTHGIATSGPTCNILGPGALLFPDDLAFDGIQKAVHEIGHVLGEAGHDGDTADCPAETGHVLASSVSAIGRKWSDCSLRHISNALKRRGWCFEDAKEFHPPGKPIETILPGKLLPASKQCQARGWTDGNVCWDYVTCDYLYCSNNHWSSTCKNSGAPADGTTCGTGQMCLDGRCISNSTWSDTRIII